MPKAIALKPVAYLLGLLALTCLILVGSVADAQARDSLSPGETLERGQELKSPNGRFKLLMQNDGNLVLYDRSSSIWSSNTQGQPSRALALQNDGNLVLYKLDGRPAWETRTNGKSVDRLVLQNDGNLVLVPRCNPVWASGTNR